MLETLHDEEFAPLEDAYGPATLVPDLLRTAAGPRDDAERAIGELEGGIFHQGGFFNATAPACRYLVELVRARVPARTSILALLGAMAAGFRPPTLAWNPYHFYPTPGPPEYPEAAATLAVIASARSDFEAALRDADPEVRAAAAHLLAALEPPRSNDALVAALAREVDDDVRVTLVLALAHLGHRVSRGLHGTAAEVAIVTDVLYFGDTSLDTLPTLERIALHPRMSYLTMPFEAGDIATFALMALERLASTHHDAVVAALWRTIEARFARGERLIEQRWPATMRVGDDAVSPPPNEPLGDDSGLRAVAQVLSRLVVREPPEGEFLRREALSAGERRVLSLTVDHGIPLPLRSAPWITPATMKRFLVGGGPLDRVVTVDGRSAPLFEHLHRLPAANEPTRGAAVSALVATCDREQLFDLVLDIFTGAYPATHSSPWPWLAVTEMVPLAQDRLLPLRSRFVDFADGLAKEPFVQREHALFALLPWLVDGTLPPLAYDRLVTPLLTLEPEKRVAWLSRFPEPRRSRIVAATGNGWVLGRIASACEPAALQRAVLEAFVAPACQWLTHDAQMMLEHVDDLDALKAARDATTGTKRKLLDRVIRERTGEGMLVLTLREVTDGIEVALREKAGGVMASRTITRAVMPDELRFVAEAITEPARTVVDIDSELDSTITYQVVLRLGSLVRCEIREGAMTRLPPDASDRGSIDDPG